ncbi:DUF1080 domain-containing protein [Bacteroidota bacterium]
MTKSRTIIRNSVFGNISIANNGMNFSSKSFASIISSWSGSIKSWTSASIVVFFLVLTLFAYISYGCGSQKGKETKSEISINQLTEQEKKDGWILLFDGETFNNWRGMQIDTLPPGWILEDQSIKKMSKEEMPRKDGKPVKSGDLISTNTYENFELAWEWKISPNGNSGVKYNVLEELSGGTHALGWEYQIVDDTMRYIRDMPNKQAGALYDMIAPAYSVTKPVGEYNKSRLIFNGNHGEHWLNGKKVVEYDMNTVEFDSLFQLSKYRDIPGFRTRKKGHIVLQDHPGSSWFRNIKIRVLNPGEH